MPVVVMPIAVKDEHRLVHMQFILWIGMVLTPDPYNPDIRDIQEDG